MRATVTSVPCRLSDTSLQMEGVAYMSFPPSFSPPAGEAPWSHVDASRCALFLSLCCWHATLLHHLVLLAEAEADACRGHEEL